MYVKGNFPSVIITIAVLLLFYVALNYDPAQAESSNSNTMSKESAWGTILAPVCEKLDWQMFDLIQCALVLEMFTMCIFYFIF